MSGKLSAVRLDALVGEDKTLNLDEIATIKECLDELAFALANKHHSWTTKERQLYEKAIRILEEHV